MYRFRVALSKPFMWFSNLLSPHYVSPHSNVAVKYPRGVKVGHVYEARHTISVDGQLIERTFCNNCGCDLVTDKNECAACGMFAGKPISAPPSRPTRSV